MPGTFFILINWKKQQRVFLQNLAKLSKQQETKAVHDLRVAIKKLRSYLKLLNTLLNKIEDESSFEKTEHLFTVLGKQRDIEMGLVLLQSFEKENMTTYMPFRSQLKMVLEQTKAWVQKALSKYDEKELADVTRQWEQQLKDTDNQRLLNRTEVVINKEIKKLKRAAKNFARQPHEVRKMLKNIFYWISICPKDFLINNIQLKKLKKSLDWLGGWQDHTMLHRKVKHFRKDFMPSSREEYQLMKELEKSIEAKMGKLLKKADIIIQEFISV